MDRRLTEERGGDEEGKRRRRHGTEGLRIRKKYRKTLKKVSGLIIWLALLIARINVLNRTSPNAPGL